MPKLTSILCPIDYAETSIKVYACAQSLAAHYKADLFLLHVLYSYPAFYIDQAYRETARKAQANALRKLKEFAKRQTHGKAQPQCIVKEGIPTDAILSAAELQGVDLIVMGSHGLRGVDRLILGSVLEKVLRKARSPVLVVRRTAHDLDAPGKSVDAFHLRKILVCTDFSGHAHRAFEYGLSFAEEYNAELTVLHVLEHVSRPSELRTARAKLTKQYIDSVRREGRNPPPVKFLVRAGKPYHQIINLASESQSDLVVMGVRGRSSLNSAIFGSATHRVIQLGPCPVLAIHL